MVADRETRVRALGFSLIGSVAISVMDPYVARQEMEAARQGRDVLVQEWGAGAGEEKRGEHDAADAAMPAPQHLEFLNMSVERALDESEVRVLRRVSVWVGVLVRRMCWRSLLVCMCR